MGGIGGIDEAEQVDVEPVMPRGVDHDPPDAGVVSVVGAQHAELGAVGVAGGGPRDHLGLRLMAIHRGVLGGGVAGECEGAAQVGRHLAPPLVHVVGQKVDHAGRTAQHGMGEPRHLGDEAEPGVTRVEARPDRLRYGVGLIAAGGQVHHRVVPLGATLIGRHGLAVRTGVGPVPAPHRAHAGHLTAERTAQVLVIAGGEYPAPRIHELAERLQLPGAQRILRGRDAEQPDLRIRRQVVRVEAKVRQIGGGAGLAMRLGDVEGDVRPRIVGQHRQNLSQVEPLGGAETSGRAVGHDEQLDATLPPPLQVEEDIWTHGQPVVMHGASSLTPGGAWRAPGVSLEETARPMVFRGRAARPAPTPPWSGRSPRARGPRCWPGTRPAWRAHARWPHRVPGRRSRSCRR